MREYYTIASTVDSDMLSAIPREQNDTQEDRFGGPFFHFFVKPLDSMSIWWYTVDRLGVAPREGRVD